MSDDTKNLRTETAPTCASDHRTTRVDDDGTVYCSVCNADVGGIDASDEERALAILPEHLKGGFWDDVRKRIATGLAVTRLRQRSKFVRSIRDYVEKRRAEVAIAEAEQPGLATSPDDELKRILAVICGEGGT
jgi:hypothetical protein